MDKVVRIVRRLILLFGVVICIGVTLHNIDNVPVEIDGSIYIVDEYSDTYYEMLSDNVGLTTINGISNVYQNMKIDGYEVYNQEITKNSVDVSFIKEGFPSYRYYFKYPEGRVTFFCSDYESSYTGLAYIIERKE